jgi:uncharacterized membrane protein
MDSEEFRNFLVRHKWTLVCVGVGLIFTILVFTINFWRTLLLGIVIGIGFLIGSLMDKGGIDNVKDFFEKLLPKLK